MTVKNYVLDINKTSLQHPSIVLRQDDYNIYTVNISVTENGVPVNLGSYTLNFLGITPAGAKIIDSKNFITNAGDLAVGKFSYRFPKEAAGSKGVYDVAYFRLKTTSGATSTIDINLRVLGGIDLTADEVKDYITVDDILRNTLVSEVFKKVDAKVDRHLATVKKGDKGDNGDKGEDGYMPVIGGRNLLVGSRNFDGETWSLYSSNLNQSDFQGLTSTSNSVAWKGPRINTSVLEKQGKITSTIVKYILSAWVNNTGTSPVDIGFYSTSEVSPTNYVVATIPAKSGWVRIASKPFSFIKTSGLSGTIQFQNTADTQGGVIKQAGLNLDAGNVDADWSPAPEDIDSVIAKAPKLNGNNMYVGNNTYMGTNIFMDGVTLSGKNVVNNIKDTDWLDVPLASGRTGTAQYKVSLGKVFVHISNLKGVTATGNNAQGQICTLPINPSSFYSHYLAPAGNNAVMLALEPSGILYLDSTMGNTIKETDIFNADFMIM